MRKESIVKNQPSGGRRQQMIGNLRISLFITIVMFMVVACTPKPGQVRPDEQLAAVPASVDKVEVSESDGQYVLTIKTTASIQGKYTLMKISEPPKVIIEMPTVEPGKFSGPIEVQNGTIGRIDASSIDGKGIRFEIGLSSLVEHEVKSNDNLIEVAFAKASKREVPAVANIDEKSQEKDVKEPVLEAPTEKAQEEIKAAEAVVASTVPVIQEKAAAPAEAEQPKVEDKAETRISAEKSEAAERTLKVSDVKISKVGKFTTAEIVTDGEPAAYNVFTLKAPARVVVDIDNAREISAKKEIKVKSTHIKGARVGRYDGQVRVVFDYKGEVKPFDVVKGKDRIVIFFGRKPVVAKDSPKVKEPAKRAAIKKDSKEKSKAEVEEKAEAAPVAQPAAQVAEVRVAEVKPETSKKEEARVDPKAEENTVSATQTVVQAAEAKAEEKENAAAPSKAILPIDVKAQDVNNGDSLKEGAEKSYVGQKVTLEFKDADIKNIFRVIAEVSGYNMIIDNSVGGKVTLRLVNVPWDQALDLILDTNGLGMTKVGNVIRVLPVAMIKKEEEAKVAAKKSKEKLEDLLTKLIPISYGKAADITARIKSVMSERGTAEVDDRTNTIILKDIKKSIEDAEKLVRSLDEPTPQIVIEARIVEASTNFSRNLGIQWGAGYAADAAHGNPTGYYFPNSYSISGGGGGSFALNPPATGGVGAGVNGGGVVGINFGSINNTLNLDLRLSALETQGWGKVISSPKVVTLDNKAATIEQGFDIPYQTTSSSGTQTEFKAATLKLEVTPHATPDNRLNLKVTVNKDAPTLTFASSAGVPSILKNKAVTELLVKDGETTVIGGIYQTTKGETETYTPFLGKIPIIGWLFKSKTVEDKNTELLIFITPRVVREKPV